VASTPLQPRPLNRNWGHHYQGLWRLPGPDSHRQATANLPSSYVTTTTSGCHGAQTSGRTPRVPCSGMRCLWHTEERPRPPVPASDQGAAVDQPEVWPGRAFPLGATWDGEGTNFSLFSEVAEAVELSLFDDDGAETRVSLEEVDAHCWHAYLPWIGAGQRYGYRIHGPWAPHDGHRANPAKLLIDPYAKAIDGNIDWDPSCFPYQPDDPDQPDDSDNAAHLPKSIVA